MELNKVMLIGRISNDLEVKTIGENGDKVVNFNLAVNQSYKSKDGTKVEQTEFVRCVAFGGLAGMIGQYLEKGRKIFVEGKIKTRQWEDQSGAKRYTTEVIVQNLNFCESGNKTNTNSQNQSNTESTEEEDIPF